MNTDHVWCTPELATCSGKQLFFCENCGVLRPAPDKEACGVNNFWAYETPQARDAATQAKPLRASIVLTRLLAAVRRDP